MLILRFCLVEMDFDLCWLFIVVSLGFCVWVGWQFVYCFVWVCLFGDVLILWICLVVQGFVEFYGVFEEGLEGLLQVFLIGKLCLWWCYCIEVEEKCSGCEKVWCIVDKGVSELLFSLCDVIDVCLVDLCGVEV